MKKTMFITSVIMVVVMAIALTTSSLAWFNAAGTSTVSTSALKLKARSVASAGLQISVTNRSEGWADYQILEGFTTDLEPMMPLIGINLVDPTAVSGNENIATYLGALNTVLGESCATSAFTDWVSDYNNAHSLTGEAAYNASTGADAQNSIATILAAKKKANLIQAIGEPVSSGEGFGFISQKIASTGNYARSNGTSGTAVAPIRYGFFTDDLWITNTASGTPGEGFAGRDVYVIPSIKFYSAYTDSTTNTKYYETGTPDPRDPDLFVAILADTDDTAVTEYKHMVDDDSDSSTPDVELWNTSTSEPNEAVQENSEYVTRQSYNYDTWEIVNIFHSQGGFTGAGAAVKMGKTYASFLSDAVVAESYYNGVAASALRATDSGRNSTLLAKASDGAAFGAAKHFRVVAWYAGDTLNNNNSGFELYFELSFDATLS